MRDPSGAPTAAKPGAKPGAAAYAPVAPLQTGAPATGPVGPRGNLDAVAGTPKDPLNNKSFDLNSPKVVPALRP